MPSYLTVNERSSPPVASTSNGHSGMPLLILLILATRPSLIAQARERACDYASFHQLNGTPEVERAATIRQAEAKVEMLNQA